MAGPSAAPKETLIGSFRAHGEYDLPPAPQRYAGPTLAVVMPVNAAQRGPHNLGADLPRIAFTGTGRWLRMDKPEEFGRILDEFLARVRAAGAPRSRKPR